MKFNVVCSACIASLMLLVGCSRPVGVAGGPNSPLKMSHPGLATSQSVFLTLYRSTPEGLLVSGLFPDAPVDPNRNPATVLQGFTFTADPSVHGSYFWSFADGVTLLDGTCQKTDKAGILADAARDGGISVQFATFLYADKRPWAPPAVHVFSRALHETSNCTNTVLADPAFAPNPP